MSDAVLVSAPASNDAVNYQETTIQVDGFPMTFRYYLGFASRITYTPKGGAPILVYQQEGVFQVPENEQGKREVLAQSKLHIKGGPDGLDVELEIDDAPITSSNRGPVSKVQVVTKKLAKDPKHDKRVKVLKGGHQVQSVDVTMAVDMGKGGVIAYQQDPPGGTTTVNNTASCCPPDCGG